MVMERGLPNPTVLQTSRSRSQERAKVVARKRDTVFQLGPRREVFTVMGFLLGESYVVNFILFLSRF